MLRRPCLFLRAAFVSPPEELRCFRAFSFLSLMPHDFFPNKSAQTAATLALYARPKPDRFPSSRADTQMHQLGAAKAGLTAVLLHHHGRCHFHYKPFSFLQPTANARPDGGDTPGRGRDATPLALRDAAASGEGWKVGRWLRERSGRDGCTC